MQNKNKRVKCKKANRIEILSSNWNKAWKKVNKSSYLNISKKKSKDKNTIKFK
jgi:hypothetical protein